MLTAHGVYKSYEGLEVLKGISLQIEPSTITSIVGKSGTGKSTLLHILGTLDEADKGNVIIDNVDVSQLSEKKLAQFRNQKIGFVFQFHHLIPEFNAIENVMIPALVSNNISRQKIKDKATELLSILGLAERISHKPSELSGGEQQRVSIARALINDPKIIFADEPTGNLDTQTSQELHELFISLRDKLNQTFVIVTHNPELANLSDRKLEIVDGQIKV